MICPKCGTQNNVNSNFCIGCGSSISVVEQPQPINNQNINTQSIINQTQSVNYQSINSTVVQPKTTQNFSNTDTKISIVEYFFMLVAVILKPYSTLKEELHKFDKFKNSAILTLIVSIGATIITLIKTMLNAVLVKSYSWSERKYITNWEWKNLENVEYIETIGKSILFYLIVIVAIAGVYYIGCLITKKETNFSRLLGISVISIVPFIVCSSIISPIIAKIYAPIGMIVSAAGGIYTILIMYETINGEMKLEGNFKYYFNLICLTILIFIIYYASMKLLIGSILVGMGDIFDLFG